MAARWGVEGVKLTVSIVLQAADKACRGDNRQVVVYVGCFAKLMRFHKESVDQVRCPLDSRSVSWTQLRSVVVRAEVTAIAVDIRQTSLAMR